MEGVTPQSIEGISVAGRQIPFSWTLYYKEESRSPFPIQRREYSEEDMCILNMFLNKRPIQCNQWI